MRETNDGFRIAEEDLRLRGAVEILGTRQSGEAQFRLASPEHIQSMLPVATDDARLLVDRDGGLEGQRGQAARTLLYLFERDSAVGLLRGGQAVGWHIAILLRVPPGGGRSDERGVGEEGVS